MSIPLPARLGVLLAAAGGSLVLAGPASAGTAGYLPNMTFAAAAGEANTLTITYMPGTTEVRFDDGARAVTPGPGCTAVGDDVDCPSGTVSSNAGFDIDLGDLNDSVAFVGFQQTGLPTGAPIPFALTGGLGNDTLTAPATGPAGATGLYATSFVASATTDGDDTLTGGAGPDTADYGARTAPLAVNLASTAKQTITGTEGDTLASSIEGLTGGAGNDVLLGDDGGNPIAGGAGADVLSGLGGADTLTGLAGNDLIAGGTGADTLDGGADDDVLQGGLGGDTIVGGAGTDALSYADSDRTGGVTVTVNSGTAATQTVAAGETESLATLENLIGSPGDDTLRDAAGVNVLDGRAGTDLIVAEPGTTGGLPPAPNNMGDTYRGGDGIDTVTYDDATNRRTTPLTLSLDATKNDGAAGETDLLDTDLENVTGGSGADTITGSGVANGLSGGAGDDTINARENVKDVIACGAGTDTTTVDPLDEVADCETVDRNAVPVVSAADVAVTEGAPGTTAIAAVKVSLGAVLSYPASVKYTTADRTAVAGQDYEPTSGTLTFAPGETEKSVGVTIKGDGDVEDNEVLTFALSSPTAAVLKGDGTSLVGLFADDFAPATAPTTTSPVPPRKVRGVLTGKGTPVRDRRAPYSFVLTGKLTLPTNAPASATCAGEKLTVAAKLGSTTTRKTLTLTAACTYRTTVKVGSPKNRLPRAGRRVVVSLSTAGTATLLRAATKKVSLRVG